MPARHGRFAFCFRIFSFQFSIFVFVNSIVEIISLPSPILFISMNISTNTTISTLSIYLYSIYLYTIRRCTVIKNWQIPLISPSLECTSKTTTPHVSSVINTTRVSQVRSEWSYWTRQPSWFRATGPRSSLRVSLPIIQEINTCQPSW